MGNDRFYADPGLDHYRGGQGLDEASFYGAGRSGIRANLTKGVIHGRGHDRVSGIENVEGTRGGDVIIGSSRDEILEGGDGQDALFGRGGADFFNAHYEPDVDRYDGGSGRDFLDVSSFGERTYADLGRGLLFKYNWRGRPVDYRNWPYAALPRGFRRTSDVDRLRHVESLIGGDAHDYFVGDAADNVFIGGGGPDHLEGRAGEDYLIGSAALDALYGGEARDVLIGDCRRLRYNEWALYDYECRAARDDLFGESGDDVLVGDCALKARANRCGEARDQLHGGRDVDVVIRCVGRHSQGKLDTVVTVEDRLPCTWAQFVAARPPRPDG
ncbi:MAG TPA: hypothetical protein VIG64_10400 [Actinomycetota bacterium]